tara:strand:+ start:432 stop:776 length:345 start_codon:yes stop_codon:yes gene_type:complete
MTESKISKDDFLIRVKPMKNDTGDYTGEANFSVISSEDSEVPILMYKDIEYLVKCMLSTIPLMEQDEEFRDFVDYYVTNNFKYEFGEDKVKPLIHDVDGNVITINFNTDTEGSA